MSTNAERLLAYTESKRLPGYARADIPRELRRLATGSPRRQARAGGIELRRQTETRRWVFQACPYCGYCIDGGSAGGGGADCQRCRADLRPSQYPSRLDDFPVVDLVNGAEVH